MPRKRHCFTDSDPDSDSDPDFDPGSECESESDPTFKPGMELHDYFCRGDLRSLKKNSSSSRHERLKTSRGKAVRLTRSASRKARSKTSFHALAILPAEIWMKIFQFRVHADGPLPFLLRASRVCRTWRDLAMDPALWEKVDLTCRPMARNLEALECLATSRLSRCREITLKGWRQQTDAAVELIARHCPQLQKVSLSKSRLLSSVGLADLFKNCQKLQDVDLSFTSCCAMSSIGTHLRDTGVQGSSLECLRLTASRMESLTTNFEEVMRNCPQLKELHLGSNAPSCEILGIDLNILETSCPLLRVLDLDNVPMRIKHPSQETQVLRCGMVNTDPYRPHEHGILGSLIPRLLHNSTQLKVLDLYGYFEFDASALALLPAMELEELNLSPPMITKSTLEKIFRKWRHSLIKVTLDYMQLDQSELESAFTILTDLPTCPLQEIILIFTSTSLSCIRLLTGKLKYLEVLHVSSWNIPPELNRRHRGWYALKRLHRRLCELENEPDSD